MTGEAETVLTQDSPQTTPAPQAETTQDPPAQDAETRLSPEDEAAKAERKRQFYALRQLAKAAKVERDTTSEAQRLARELEAERRARAEAEARAAKFEGPKPPKAEDFPVYEDYLVAKAKFELKQEMAQAQPQHQPRPQQQPQQDPRAVEQFQAREIEYGQRVAGLLDETVKKYPDLATYTPETDMPNFREMNPAVLRGVFTSEAKHELVNHIWRNPDVAWRLAAMKPEQTIRELGRLEAQIEAGRVTNAPAPPTTVGGGGVQKTGLRDDLSAEEWVRRRNEQVRQQRRGR